MNENEQQTENQPLPGAPVRRIPNANPSDQFLRIKKAGQLSNREKSILVGAMKNTLDSYGSRIFDLREMWMAADFIENFERIANCKALCITRIEYVDQIHTKSKFEFSVKLSFPFEVLMGKIEIEGNPDYYFRTATTYWLS